MKLKCQFLKSANRWENNILNILRLNKTNLQCLNLASLATVSRYFLIVRLKAFTASEIRILGQGSFHIFRPI